ncbi:MAG: pyridoxine 5'-phosphate synthase [Candidatus Omnitrophica bacterium]|nr:pyridoxine 5'-phosphate synthase [Candidatus Omnitrophota bacterium]
MPKLGVNIDHVATLRQARREFEPDPIQAAAISLQAGADSIVCHLREDRRHIQDDDVKKLRRLVKKNLTLEMAISKDIVKLACIVRPDRAMLVPEKRTEVTTEGGLNVVKYYRNIAQTITTLNKKNIPTCLFIDPSKKQIKMAHQVGSTVIELHTGVYANAKTKTQKKRELQKLNEMSAYAHSLGLIVNAGHGLKYHDTRSVAQIKYIDELNIGHSIISRAVFVGLANAVKEMRKIVKG